MSDLAIIDFNTYRPSLQIGKQPSAPTKFKVWNHLELSDKNLFFSSFNVTYSFNAPPTMSITIPLVNEDVLDEFTFGSRIKMKLGTVGTIFDGFITGMQYQNTSVQITCSGFTSLLQNLYNPAIAFSDGTNPITDLQTILKDLIKDSLSAQGVESGFDIKYYQEGDTPMTISLDATKYQNTDSYSALQQILSSAGMIGFETMIGGQPTFILGHFKVLWDKFFLENMQQVPIGAFYDRSKSYTTDGIANAIFVMDKSSGDTVMIYPNNAPGYMPQANTKWTTYKSSKLPALDLIFSSIAIYDALPDGETVTTIGEKLIDASYLNYTNATLKFPGIPFQDQGQPTLLFPGIGFNSPAGTGLVSSVTYSFSGLKLWTTIKKMPR